MSMTNLQGALGILVCTFNTYASKDGDNKSLTKAEAKELLQSELGELLGKADDQAAVDCIFKAMDENQDKTVNFEEFIIMFAHLAMVLHDLVTSS
ncbi:ictacalcin-like [Epinephelus fuscoguttatus]|uniref:ictacalcin-like n=1 Tax=Epinephelus fuscoguttatus TaxID=293821 RepID=UPI0020D046CC|nr:ictacalcin-like [Epinephelus fuscoguttatus]